jgi:hypothetical protein
MLPPTHPPTHLPPVLNVPLWLAYGILHAGAVPSVQYPLMCALLLVALMGGAYLSLVRPGPPVLLFLYLVAVSDAHTVLYRDKVLDVLTHIA